VFPAVSFLLDFPPISYMHAYGAYGCKTETMLKEKTRRQNRIAVLFNYIFKILNKTNEHFGRKYVSP
jgi:hypothetical protein